MLYVRNPTGISHSPEEFAEAGDVEAGAAALATVLERLAR
jgi:N-carbamoyl-L-amino-acid hydrolase